MAKSPVSRFRVAIYGILIEAGKILMTETRVPNGTIVNFPGGGLELGEDPVDAVVREFHEETGLAVTVGPLLHATRRCFSNRPYPEEQLIHHYYLVERQGGSIRDGGNGDDIAALLWFSRGDLPLERIEPVDREFLESEVLGRLMSG